MATTDWRLMRSRWRLGVPLMALCLALLITGWYWPSGLLGQWIVVLVVWSVLLADIGRALRPSWQGLALRHGQWFLLSETTRLPTRLIRYHCVGQRMCVLTFSEAGGRRHWISILPDMMAPDDFRSLRLALLSL